MNCQDVQKFAYTYLDAEFDGRERGEFETHLRMCPPCRQAVERDALFRDLVREKLCVDVPCDDLKQRLQARLACVEQRRSMTRVAVPMALAATVTVGIVAWRWQVQTPTRETAVRVATAPAVGTQLALHPNALQANGPATAVAPGAGGPMAALQVPAGTAGQLPAARAVAQVALSGRGQPVLAGARPSGSGLQLVSANAREPGATGEVLRGALAPTSLVDRSPFGAVRSEASLRAMARVHAAQFPPEVGGPASKVQRYLTDHMPATQGGAAAVPPLPLSEGAGVELIGARLAVMGPQLVVVYSYRAYGVPLTVFSRAKANAADGDEDDPEVEAKAPEASDSGVLLDQRAGLHLLHVVSRDRVLTLVSELSASALLPLVPKATWL